MEAGQCPSRPGRATTGSAPSAHRARKATWLYTHGTELPSLKWGPSSRRVRIDFGFHSAEERRKFARPPAGLSDDERTRRREWLEWYERETGKAWCAPERMGRYERLATPIQFRDLLISIARSVDAKKRQQSLDSCSYIG